MPGIKIPKTSSRRPMSCAYYDQTLSEHLTDFCVRLHAVLRTSHVLKTLFLERCLEDKMPGIKIPKTSSRRPMSCAYYDQTLSGSLTDYCVRLLAVLRMSHVINISVKWTSCIFMYTGIFKRRLQTTKDLTFKSLGRLQGV